MVYTQTDPRYKINGYRQYKFRHFEEPSLSTLRRVKSELKNNGVVAYDLWLPETHYLPNIIHDGEHIMGSVYGRYSNGAVGRGVLVATDQRVLFLDKKPGYLHCDELTYMIVGGVTHNKVGPIGYVILHTRLGDYKLRTFNQNNADHFVDYIEARCLQAQAGDGEKYDYLT
jgi:hypothetical protein